MVSYREKHRDFFEISRLINLNFDVDVIVAKSISFISDRLRKRVRIYLLDDRKDLTIKQWAGDYEQELRKGIVVVRTSIVWEVFQKGEAINITDESQVAHFDQTLKSRIAIKAVIPIKYKDANSSVEEKFGVMVIDSGREGAAISEDDFLYSLETAELIGQGIARARFFNEYRHIRDRLSLIQEERIRVLNVLVHELRNPLTVIGGYTKRFPRIIEKLYTTIKPEERSAYLDKLFKYSKIIAKEEYRIEESINDFIKLLEVTDPQYRVSVAPFSLNRVIEDVISKVEPLAEIKNIRIYYSKKEICVEGQEEGIFTVLSNIIHNAINFSPDNSRITIFTKEDDENVSFSVRSDTFIPRQHRKRIFEYYYKVVGKENKGTGLGLPVAKQIVENHKGTITVISRKRRKGKPFTRFIVRLPKKVVQCNAEQAP